MWDFGKRRARGRRHQGHTRPCQCSPRHLPARRGWWFPAGIDERWEGTPRDLGKERDFPWAWQHRAFPFLPGITPVPLAALRIHSLPGQRFVTQPRPSSAASDKVGHTLGPARHRGSLGWRTPLKGASRRLGGFGVGGGLALPAEGMARPRRGLVSPLPLGWGDWVCLSPSCVTLGCWWRSGGPSPPGGSLWALLFPWGSSCTVVVPWTHSQPVQLYLIQALPGSASKPLPAFCLAAGECRGPACHPGSARLCPVWDEAPAAVLALGRAACLGTARR